jgi:hypothetical protein
VANIVEELWRPSLGGCTVCGGGLLGTYYPGQGNEWGSPSYTRIDATLTYPFGGNGLAYNEPVPGASPNQSTPLWTATWTGQIKANTTEPYTFYVRVDNAVWLYIGGQLAISRSADGGACQTWQATAQPIPMTANQWVDIEVRYQQRNWGSPSHVSVQWSSPSMPQQEIPSCNLRPPLSN